MPAPSDDTMIFFCGPKHFNEFMFEELPKLGYVKDHHFIKF